MRRHLLVTLLVLVAACSSGSKSSTASTRPTCPVMPPEQRDANAREVFSGMVGALELGATDGIRGCLEVFWGPEHTKAIEQDASYPRSCEHITVTEYTGPDKATSPMSALVTFSCPDKSVFKVQVKVTWEEKAGQWEALEYGDV